MTDLLSLIDHPDPEPIGRDRPLDARFADWLKVNDELVAFVTRRALAAARSGLVRLSAKRLAEEARASALVTTSGRRDWKLDNTMVAPLASWLMEHYPELDGKFEVRRRRQK